MSHRRPAIGCGQAGSLPPAAAREASLAPGRTADDAFAEGLVVIGTATINAELEMAHVTFGGEVRGTDVQAVVDEGSCASVAPLVKRVKSAIIHLLVGA